jgi:hypothetical protein
MADLSASEIAGNTSFHPSSDPILSRVFLRTIPTVLPKLRGGKSDLDRKLCSTNESQSLIANIREGKKGPAEGTRERSTPAPPEAEGPSADISKSNTTNNVIAPGSEVNLSRLRIRPNESYPRPRARHRPAVRSVRSIPPI